jgi:hypothetical protein
MVNCPHCDRANQADATYCSGCGRILRTSFPFQLGKEKKFNRAFGLLTLAFAISLLGGFAIFHISISFIFNNAPSPINTSIITNATPTQAPPAPIPTPTATTKKQTYIVSVSASQDLPGVNTGISVSPGERISIVAQGVAYYGGEGQPECSGNPATLPDGTRSVNGQPCPLKPDPNAALSGANIGMLLGNIGQGWFAIGNSDQFTAATGGILFLLYNDVPGYYDDNSGSYQVTVTVG